MLLIAALLLSIGLSFSEASNYPSHASTPGVDEVPHRNYFRLSDSGKMEVFCPLSQQKWSVCIRLSEDDPIMLADSHAYSIALPQRLVKYADFLTLEPFWITVSDFRESVESNFEIPSNLHPAVCRYGDQFEIDDETKKLNLCPSSGLDLHQMDLNKSYMLVLRFDRDPVFTALEHFQFTKHYGRLEKFELMLSGVSIEMVVANAIASNVNSNGADVAESNGLSWFKYGYTYKLSIIGNDFDPVLLEINAAGKESRVVSIAVVSNVRAKYGTLISCVSPDDEFYLTTALKMHPEAQNPYPALALNLCPQSGLDIPWSWRMWPFRVPAFVVYFDDSKILVHMS